MRGPYPGELRRRVVGFVEAGGSRREAAEQFDIGVSSAIRWMQRFRELANRCRAAEALRHWRSTPNRSLCSTATQPDLTLDEIVLALHKRRISGSPSASWHHYKKSLRAVERNQEDVAPKRRRWIREQGLLDPARLVFIDETAVSTNMVRPNGWSPRGTPYWRGSNGTLKDAFI
jgi:transposase